MVLGKRGAFLLKRYQEILDISEELAEEIFNRNLPAYKYISSENCLRLFSESDNLNTLFKITLFRKHYDRAKLKKSEIEILEKYYNINYKEFDINNLLKELIAGKASIKLLSSYSESIIDNGNDMLKIMPNIGKACVSTGSIEENDGTSKVACEAQNNDVKMTKKAAYGNK